MRWTMLALSVPLACAAAGQPPQDPKQPLTPEIPPQAVAPPPAPEQGPIPVPATRADLALHLARVDALFMQHLGNAPGGLSPERTAQLNKEFDKATAMWMGGDYRRAIDTLDQIAQSLLTAAGGTIAPTIGTSISAIVEPPVWWPSSPATPVVRVRSPWKSAIDATVTVELRWDDGRASPESHPSVTRELELKKDRAIELDVPLSDFGAWPEGGPTWAEKQYTLHVGVRGYRENAVARYCVVPRSLDVERKLNEKKLAGMRASLPDLVDALEICLERNRLLSDYPGAHEPVKFEADYPRLLAEVKDEIASLEAGKDPYSRRTGEIYRPIVGRGNPDHQAVPCVVYACSQSAGDTPLPVIIALHGVGGDASTFVRAAGGGRLAQLAETKGFILASVQSYKLGGHAAVFDNLLNQLEQNYAIDRTRVYLIGHAMGAGMATYLAQVREDAVAGVVCMSGCGKAGARTAPTRVYSGALDPIVTTASLRTLVDEARAKKLPVELNVVPDYGHTLIINAKIDEAVDWLLARTTRRAPGP